MIAAPTSSPCRPGSGANWPEWLGRGATLVAEELRRLRDPLAAWLRPGPPVPAEAVAAALARALLPAVAPDAPPEWLRPDQRLSYQRALAAARRFGGVLLADGVGTGKTYVGLAVASRLLPGAPVHAVIPAGLRSQWDEAARRTGIAITIHTHETLSRGRAPPPERGAVVVDESHRFREPATVRYRTLRRWCVGRRGVLLSATPAVNRLEDVAHQALLLVRDDALAWRGAATLLAGRCAEVVVTGSDYSEVLPARRERRVRIAEPLDSPAMEILRGIEALALSADPGIAAILRLALLQALASSPAAVTETLTRYQALLLHAKDALASGRRVTRQQIRRLVGGSLDQLLLWPMVAEAPPLPELALADLDQVAGLIARSGEWCRCGDRKLEELRRQTGDAKPTLVFSSYLATVRHIRTGLGGSGVAWCTGNSAGLGRMPASREVVLDWFRRRAPPYPRVLVASDVAAEGLDLPLIERVIHYDLPWTAIRLEQRSGRAVRLTTTAREVEVIRFLPAPALESLIRKEAIIERKAALPEALGLSGGELPPWKLRARTAEAWRGFKAVEGTAQIAGQQRAMVAGFRLIRGDGERREVVTAHTPDGWTDDLAVISPLLASAMGARAAPTINPAALRRAMALLARVVRSALATAHGAASGAAPATPARRRLIGRMRRLARGAVRDRNPATLDLLERGIGFVRRGHTAGETAMLEDWLRLADDQLLARLGRLSVSPPEEFVAVELIGVLLLEPARQTR